MSMLAGFQTPRKIMNSQYSQYTTGREISRRYYKDDTSVQVFWRPEIFFVRWLMELFFVNESIKERFNIDSTFRNGTMDVDPICRR